MDKINKKSRKAQLKVQEMAFMLMAVVLFFILAFLFFMTIKYKQMYKEAGLIEQEKALSTVSKLADTAEFTCTFPRRSLCVDEDKLLVMKDRKAYAGFWPVTSLSVVRVFPETDNKDKGLVECTEANYPDCNLFSIYEKQGKGNESTETLSVFVSLCRKDTKNNYVYEKCELGKMLAGFEPKQAGE